MRILRRDPTSGITRLRLETPSDLWRLSRLVAAGDRVGSLTTRRDPDAPAEVAAAERSRRRVWLVVEADDVEFHGFSGHVRVPGRIAEGPFDLGHHHTLDVSDGDEVTIQKTSWSATDEVLLREGEARAGERRILLAAVDWGESTVVRLQGRAIFPLAEVTRGVSGKRYPGGQAEKDRRAYREELVQLIEREFPQSDALAVAGPGFLKEEVVRTLAERHPEWAGRVRLYPTAESGRTGIQELLRSGRATELLKESAAAKESELIERLIGALGGGRRAAVGQREVMEANEMGAVETLLVSEAALREPAIAPLLSDAKAKGGDLFVVREEGENGRKLEALGRVAALLRFDFRPTARGPGNRPRAEPEPIREGRRSVA